MSGLVWVQDGQCDMGIIYFEITHSTKNKRTARNIAWEAYTSELL